MNRDLKGEYYWVGLKKDVAELVKKGVHHSLSLQAYALFPTMQIASVGKARRQGGSKITFVQPKFCISGVEYRYPISGIGTQFQHWNLGIGTREEYRYPSSPLGLEYRYWLPSTDTSCLKTVFGTP
ncbi:hypothetical protein GQ457_14G012100 [Hibiscus cannabinus]